MEPNWRLLGLLKTSNDTLTENADETTRQQLNSAYNYTRAEVALLAQRRCSCCEGFGHASASCPTRQLLQGFGGPGGTPPAVFRLAFAALLTRPGL